MTINLNRRLFLRGLGGAAVAAPFLSSVAERAAKAQGVALSQPKRFIVMFTHYGCLTNRWFPATSHGALTGDSLMGTNIEALAPYANKLLMPRGIRAMNQWHASNTGQASALGQGNDPHTQVTGSFFTCHPVTPNTNYPFGMNGMFDTAAKNNAQPTGPSLDHVCAKQLNQNGGVPLFMRVAGGEMAENPMAAISYSAAETPYAGIGSASQVYQGLTGLFDSSEPMSPDTYQAVRGKSVLDLVKDDLDTLQRLDMSQSDWNKLQAWKELLDSTGAVVTQMCTEETAMALGLSSEAFGAPDFGGDRVAGKVSGNMDYADVFNALAALSAACDSDRVIFLKYPGNYVFSALTTEGGQAVSMENHSASHRIGNAGMGGGCVNGVMDILNTIDRYYAAKFAGLVGLLDSIDEGDGTVLDNSATIWFQELSDGNAHNLNNMPILQAGSCGGYFKTGQIINLDGGTDDLPAGDSDKYCNGDNNIPLGAVDSTGTPSEFGNAPINKYYCNIMNALGVKAGADGFPAEGGTEEVRKFGKFDRTEDFFDGVSKPANITNEGEFTELKA